MPDVPQRCPQCHSPVAERFPHAVMYDCGFSVFLDGQPVTDDYPAECQRRRIKRLEKQLAAARAEIERLRREREVLAEALKHVFTCDDCECASCPEGTGLLYRAYRALGGAQHAESAS